MLNNKWVKDLFSEHFETIGLVKPKPFAVAEAPAAPEEQKASEVEEQKQSEVVQIEEEKAQMPKYMPEVKLGP